MFFAAMSQASSADSKPPQMDQLSMGQSTVSTAGSANPGSTIKYSPPVHFHNTNRPEYKPRPFPPPPTSNFFGSAFEDPFFRAESLHMSMGGGGGGGGHPKPEYKPHEYFSSVMADMQQASRCSQLDLLDQINPNFNPAGMTHDQFPHMPGSHLGFHPGSFATQQHHGGSALSASHMIPPAMTSHQDTVDADPRELESFAEKFKQRRIKLGVTQADVGKSLSHLKIPGVGSLSQSTICRFESLTLSHNNMVALKPVLHAWLEEAEAAAKGRLPDKDTCMSGIDKKRKRTSIAAPEKRSLEAYFTVQPRPSGEKIAAIAEKLDLKKNVVRVWFCNQRQKQKRLKFSAMR